MIAHTAVEAGASQKVRELAGLVDLVGELDPRVILEIGSMDGGTLRAWKAVAPDATLISVSLSGGPYGGGTVPEGITQHHLDLDSHSALALTRVLEILDGRPIDFMFIDGDHSYEGVRSDFAMYAWLVRRGGGIVAFHDILPHDDGTGIEVDRFWHELTARYEWDQFVALDELRENKVWGGIGVVYL